MKNLIILRHNFNTKQQKEDKSSTHFSQDWETKLADACEFGTYWLALLLALATMIAGYYFLKSRMGLGLQALRDNEEAARSVGVNPRRLKAWVFMITAFGTGLCGALLFIQITRVTPEAAFSVLDPLRPA